MSQIKHLVEDYTGQCAANEMNDCAKAAAYVNRHLPASAVRVTPDEVWPILGEVRQRYWDRILRS